MNTCELNAAINCSYPEPYAYKHVNTTNNNRNNIYLIELISDGIIYKIPCYENAHGKKKKKNPVTNWFLIVTTRYCLKPLSLRRYNHIVLYNPTLIKPFCRFTAVTTMLFKYALKELSMANQKLDIVVIIEENNLCAVYRGL